MKEFEYNGISNCASEFSHDREAERIIYAKPVFTDGPIASEQLPLIDVMNHPDYIDMISAQEFCIEDLCEHKHLLCILVAATEDALDEMEQILCGRVGDKKPAAFCRMDEEMISVRSGEKTYSLPASASAAVLGKEAARLQAPDSVSAAALTQWCEEYPVRFYWPVESAV